MKSKSDFTIDTCWGNFPFEMKIHIDQIKIVIQNNIDIQLTYLISQQIDLPIWQSVWRSAYLIGILRPIRKQIKEERSIFENQT